MRFFQPRGILLGLALLGLGGFGVAAAQPAEQPAPDVTVGAQRDVNLTPPQMQAEAETYLPGMEQGAGHVRRQLQDSRQKRDVVKVLCLNDKLTQIDVAIRSVRDRMVSLRGAVSSKDVDRSRHEFTVVQVLRDRVRTLVAEANQCIGEETGFVGESRVTVDIDPTIPDTEPEVPDEIFVSPPPPLSSPTL